MKLVRYGLTGRERPGILDAQGNIRDLSGHIGDISRDTLSPAGLKRLGDIEVENLPVVEGTPRFGACVGAVSKLIGVGLNYSDHAKECGLAIPEDPIIFSKAISSLCGPNDDVIMPKGSTKVDWEIELGVVIGQRAQYVSQDTALEYVAGYCIVNDVSERELQVERSGGQWDKGKGCDTFGPVGPWLVTKDELPYPQDLAMCLKVNDTVRQNGNTKTMIFSVKQLVADISSWMTLEAGDIICTGTPPGVAMGMETPAWLKSGDEMHLSIQGLGEQRQKVIAYPA
jgi:2-keto-4-pentenoate hydratase/2-oxohepta-3-ene-1,7-dioic acid hydratase in catechol pathway